jgi:selenide,water dikinase
MTTGSRVRVRVQAGAVPLLPDVVALAESGLVPGGTKRNVKANAAVVRWDDAVPEVLRLVLSDAQTSGGLLVATPDAPALLAALAAAGVETAARIGEVVGDDPAGTIEVGP